MALHVPSNLLILQSPGFNLEPAEELRRRYGLETCTKQGRHIQFVLEYGPHGACAVLFVGRKDIRARSREQSLPRYGRLLSLISLLGLACRCLLSAVVPSSSCFPAAQPIRVYDNHPSLPELISAAAVARLREWQERTSSFSWNLLAHASAPNLPFDCCAHPQYHDISQVVLFPAVGVARVRCGVVSRL